MPPPVTDTAKLFRIAGTKILDDKQQEVILKGVNVNGPYWPWSRPTVPDVALIADVWKFNAVRVNCWPQFSTINNNNADLDAIVNTFTTKKIIVILEHHGFTGKFPSGTDLTDLALWWSNLATRYKKNEYVWFNIMNEPGESKPVPVEWFNTHEAAIKAIRATGNSNIIVCDENGFGQANGYNNDASSGVITYGPQLTSQYKNILFSLHLYDQWIYGKTRLENYIAAVRTKNLALIIGEYGAGYDASMDVASEMFKVCLDKNIGRMAWHWDGQDIHWLTSAGGGWKIDNVTGARPGNCSFTGSLIWNDNHGNLTPSDAALDPPAAILFNGDFEEGNPANGSGVSNGWINFGTAFIDQTIANVKTGSNSVKVKSGQAGGCGEFIYLKPGTTFKITAWGKHSAAAASASNIGIKITSMPGGAETTIVSLNFSAASFENQTATFTTPAQINSAFIYLYKNDTAPDFWCDGITVEKQ
ncbi:MAG: cellulase family glycosylhydrolase [Chitinophagaceae bacterium]